MNTETVATQEVPQIDTRPVRKRTNKDPEFQAYLKKLVEVVNKTKKAQEWMVKLWVTMERRYRGVTVSDLCGYFSEESYKSHLWTDVTVDPNKPDVHPIPIAKPTIRANGAAMLQAEHSIVVKSRVQNAQKENGAEIGQKIADYVRQKFWQEKIRKLLFDMMQKQSCGYNYLSYERDEDVKGQVPEFGSEINLPKYEYSCDCGSEGLTEAESSLEYEPFKEMDCPDCGNKTYGIKTSDESENESFQGTQEFSFGDIKSELISPFFVTVDTLKTQGGILENARFVDISRLKTRAELELEYSHLEFHSPKEWSYALKCYYALTNNDFNILWKWQSPSESDDHDLFEERDIFLDESFYASYICPKDFQLVNKNGEEVFRILEGQTIKEALIASFGYNPKSFRFRWEGDRLLGIADPRKEPTNHKDCLSVAQFDPNSTTYLSMPFWELIQLGDDATNLNTILVEHYARNSITNIIADSEFYDLDDFSKDVILTKVPAGDIGKTVKEMNAPKLDNGINQHLAFLLSYRDEVTGVTAPMRGIPQPGQPAIAQRMQRDQAMGLLTAPLKSFGDMLVVFTRQALKLAQQFWTLEQFQAIGAEYGEEWTEDDIEDFTEADLGRDFVIECQPGSEMPQSLLEREIKFNQLVGQISGFMQTGLVTPTAINQIIKRLTEFANVDIDLSGSQQDERLATMRFRDLNAICKDNSMPPMMIEEMRKQVVAADGVQEFSALDELVKQILVEANIFISIKAENHDVHIEYYRERIKGILLKQEPNSLFVAVLEKLIELHEQAKVMVSQNNQSKQIEANQPGADEAKRQQLMAEEQNKAAEEQKQVNQQASEEESRRHQLALGEQKGNQEIAKAIINQSAKRDDYQ